MSLDARYLREITMWGLILLGALGIFSGIILCFKYSTSPLGFVVAVIGIAVWTAGRGMYEASEDYYGE